MDRGYPWLLTFEHPFPNFINSFNHSVGAITGIHREQDHAVTALV